MAAKTIKDVPVAEYGFKSGNQFDKLPSVMGGMPPKKSVDEVDKANMPENAPGSYSATSTAGRDTAGA